MRNKSYTNPVYVLWIPIGINCKNSKIPHSHDKSFFFISIFYLFYYNFVSILLFHILHHILGTYLCSFIISFLSLKISWIHSLNCLLFHIIYIPKLNVWYFWYFNYFQYSIILNRIMINNFSLYINYKNNRIHCDVFMHVYNLLWSQSLPITFYCPHYPCIPS
jgi:hypothetical protein